jgi:iron complex transport system substrate-binding protein
MRTVRYCLPVILISVVILMVGCFSPDNKSARFGGMANVQAAKTGTNQQHNILLEGTGYPYTITDYLGNKVTLQTKPTRVAVLSGTYIGLWYELGGTSICRTELGTVLLDEKYAAQIRALPSVGAVYNSNTEAIIQFQPDLIIVQIGVQSSLSETLRSLKFKIITLHMRTYSDVIDHIKVFGELLGNEKGAQDIISQMESEKQSITYKLPQNPRSAVILYATSSSLAVKLDNSIAGDVANILNLKNIASGLPPDTLGSETTPLDIEYIVKENPDMILVTSMISSNTEAKKMMQQEFSSKPAWSGIAAVKKGNVVYLPQEYFLYNAAHHYVEAIRYMAKGVYPEIYGKLDE